MKEYTVTIEQLSNSDFITRCYDVTDTKQCSIANQVHQKFYGNTDKQTAIDEYRTWVQNHMVF